MHMWAELTFHRQPCSYNRCASTIDARHAQRGGVHAVMPDRCSSADGCSGCSLVELNSTHTMWLAACIWLNFAIPGEQVVDSDEAAAIQLYNHMLSKVVLSLDVEQLTACVS